MLDQRGIAGRFLSAGYLVGCDGGRSLVRKAAGIDSAGSDPSTSWMIAEVEMDAEPEHGIRRDHVGRHAIGRGQDGEATRVALTEPGVDHSGELGIESSGLRSSPSTGPTSGYATPTGSPGSPTRRGRPPRGQSLNVGVQDAMNLGWKLAQVVHGTSPESLLDTYHVERHPVGARVLHNTMAAVALSSPDDRHQALRDITAELLAMDEPRRHVAAMLPGFDVHYDLGEAHPLLGRRMPDLDVRTAEGPTRVFALLHEARPELLDLGGVGGVGGFDVMPWADRVRPVVAGCDGVWQLPVLGEIPAPPAVLIRPDGHVTWAGVLPDPDLPRALTTRFGSPAAAHAPA